MEILETILQFVAENGVLSFVITVVTVVLGRLFWGFADLRKNQQSIDKEREENYRELIDRGNSQYDELMQKYEAALERISLSEQTINDIQKRLDNCLGKLSTADTVEIDDEILDRLED